MKKLLILSLLFICACSSPSDYKKVKVTLPDGFAVAAEVADTAPKQMLGLMYRENLPENKGMIFPYEEEQILSFWMKNTLIDLDIIFISEEKLINCVYDAVPKSTLLTKDEDVATAACPGMYVLELAAGTAEKHGLKPEQKLEFNLQ